MKSVYCLNPISNAGMSRFDDTYCIADSIENADASCNWTCRCRCE